MTGTGGQGGNVIYLGGDTGLAAALRTGLAEHLGFAALSAAAAVAQEVEASPGSVLVLDARGASAGRDGAEVFAQIDAAGAQCPIWVCLADPGDLSVRLHALRAGARACFTGAGPIDALCLRLRALAGAAADAPCRVLVVDDQKVASLVATRALEKAGMQVRALSDARGTLNAVEEMRPDLVLVDLDTPGADGIEPAHLLRDDEECFGLPVIFLSRDGTPERTMDSLRVGAGDFLVKPVPTERLVETVRRRIERARGILVRGGGVTAHPTATGLWSSGCLLQRIDRAIAGGAAKCPGAGVLYLVLDQTTAMVERPGVLDGVFAEVAAALSLDPSSSDLAARVGPGSLGLLVRRSDAAALLACAEGLRAMIADQTWTLHGARLRLTASVGVGPFLPPADDAITLISRAKKACSKARDAGGNRCEVYASALPSQVGLVRSNRMADLIREALAEDGLSLSYQPIVALRGHQGERYEALLRLRTAEGELIPPFEFLPVAREFGLMPEVDRWVMTRALDETLRRRADHQGLQILVRQTLTTAAAPGWVDWLRNEIVRRNLLRQRPALIFDLEEVSARLPEARTCFAALRRLGIDLCLSRVDETPETLQLLGQLTVSLVRLDQRILARMTNLGLMTLVAAVRRGGAAVIATGIEHPQDIARAWGCGVDYILGNFLQPADERLSFDFAGTELV